MARITSLVLALASWTCTIFALLIGLVFGLGLKCGDACSSGSGWRGDPDAWQWNGIAALGAFVFLCGAALFFFVLFGRPWLAAAAVVGGAVAAVVLAGAMSSDWIDNLDRRSSGEILLILASVFAPVLAVLLTVPAKRS